ncbi:MAG: hypothetical protein AB1762_05030 [Gemmatimonadota bacterium]
MLGKAIAALAAVTLTRALALPAQAVGGSRGIGTVRDTLRVVDTVARRDPTVVFLVASDAIIAADEIDLRSVVGPERNSAALTAFNRALDAASRFGLRASAPPILVNRLLNRQRWVFEVAVPVATAPRLADSLTAVRLGRTPNGRVVTLDYQGPIEGLGEAYRRLQLFAEGAGLTLGDLTWEQYLTNPMLTPPEAQRTRIFRTIRE